MDLEGYRDWARRELDIQFDAQATRNRYEINLQTAQNSIQNSEFSKSLRAFFDDQERAYKKKTGGDLFTSRELTVLQKPFGSAVEKSFRHNVLRNKSFPTPPKEGWITPNDWFTRFDDLVRGTLVCKFLDGPKLVAEALNSHGMQLGLKARHVPRGNERGYYAFHHYTTFPLEVLDGNFNTQQIEIELEIQLTTQLQEVLRSLTHPLYEAARLKRADRDESWKWDHDSPRFQTSYLGHTLHLIEAVILQVRNGLAPASEEGLAATKELSSTEIDMSKNINGEPVNQEVVD